MKQPATQAFFTGRSVLYGTSRNKDHKTTNTT